MESLWQAILAWFSEAKTCTGEGLNFTPCQPFWQTLGLSLFAIGILGTAAIVAYLLHRKKKEARKAEQLARRAQYEREVDEEELRKSLWKVEGPIETNLSQEELAEAYREGIAGKGKR